MRQAGFALRTPRAYAGPVALSSAGLRCTSGESRRVTGGEPRRSLPPFRLSNLPARRSQRRACSACAIHRRRNRHRARKRASVILVRQARLELGRARLAEFVRRAYRSDFHQRRAALRASFKTSDPPYQRDRGTIDVHDLVLVRNGQSEEGPLPARPPSTTRSIASPGQAPSSTPTRSRNAFSVTGTALDNRTIPESYIVIHRCALPLRIAVR